ncbi:MAG: Holliday junction branch migration protein RuvA [Paenibacillus dendritiformis]|uniref:Holliday junction branch migration protein RuvA n=1 Tax=Paenibacillus dendritiformis TaxID=130049 RepID=UPI00143D4DB4|nr:Holliday junction branch migration protein RuvA [Paenibacillus dendritiformis]MDU5144382.1 Holliday junction branch migration protein RuvA [Paenibacillus dendritiformis]NKI20518.1 Holliday junction branch migration protein RuvA [Paenibacillus dendritiformis]NRG00060.1 Holliday junction branch migration protein RuvA [Paenibacillus dendritiformis]
MIDFVRGPVVHWEADYVVLDVQGIGYRIYTPNPYAFAKSEAAVTVYTHHHVREDAILLFGFASRQEQKLFRRLIEVSGVGPKVALGILSAGKPDSVVAAIQQENYSFLTKLPGIGKKTAQRIVLDLKDKLDGMGWDVEPGSLFAEMQTIEEEREDGAWDEAREALKALGYKDVELDRVWNDLQHRVHADESVDSLMKKALQLLFTG